MDIGKSIKLACINNNTRQLDIAHKMVISPSYLSRVATKGRCSMPFAERLAKAFDMSVSEFIALGEDKSHELR